MRRYPQLFTMLGVAVLMCGGPAAPASAAGGAGPSTAPSPAPVAPEPAAEPGASDPVPAPAPVAGRTVTLANANMRASAAMGKLVRRLRAGTRVRARCTKVGAIGRSRRDGLSRLWVQVTAAGRTGWVHDALVNPSSGKLLVPLCGTRPATGPGLPGVVQGACAVTPPVKLLPPFPDTRSFIEASLPGARASWRRSRVPVSVTLAQGILETGGGKSSALGNNFFGIKARAAESPGRFVWGENAVGCTITKTREAERRGLVLTVGAFRAYRSLDASILDHGDLLTSNPVYRKAFAYTDKPTRFMAEIARHYATDPAYRTKLLTIMRNYDLTRYDVNPAARK